MVVQQEQREGSAHEQLRSLTPSAFVAELAALAESVHVIDAHQHVGSWRSFSSLLSTPSEGMTAETEARLREVASLRFAVNEVCLMPSVHHDGSAAEVRKANDDVLKQLSLSKLVTIGMFTLPLGNAEAAVAELQRCLGLGLRALTLHPRFAGKVLDHPVMWPILEALRGKGIPVFMHCLAESTLEALWRLERLAEAFPEIVFVAADALSSPSAAQWAIHVGRHRPNILFDTAVLCPLPTIIQTLCEQLGSNRLVYGSDLYVDPPIYFFPAALYEILATPVSLDDKRLILGGNIKRLFAG